MRGVAACRIVFLLVVLSIGSGGSGDIARAHVTADDMPDSVAKMEYMIYLEFKPDDALVRNKLAMVYYRLKKPARAEKEFARILEQEPANYDALDGMGLVKSVQGDYEEAIRYHRLALAVNSEDMTIHYHLGAALEKKGDLPAAAAAYGRALEIYDKQPPAADGKAEADAFGDKVRTAISNLETKL